MRGVNRVIALGTLGKDPETRDAAGKTVCNFSIAVNDRWTDRQTGEQKESTEWLRIVMWGRLAEIASQYLRKGSKVYIEGKVQTRKWQGQDGQDRYTTEILANEMQMLDGPNQRQDREAPAAVSSQATFEDDDDVPF